MSAVVADVPVVKPANAGQPWTAEEVGKLLVEVHEKVAFPEIATAHQRTLGGVVAHLKKIAYNAVKNENKSVEEVVVLTGLNEKQIQKALDVRDPSKKVKKVKAVVPVASSGSGSVQAQLAEIKALLVQVLDAVKA